MRDRVSRPPHTPLLTCLAFAAMISSAFGEGESQNSYHDFRYSNGYPDDPNGTLIFRIYDQPSYPENHKRNFNEKREKALQQRERERLERERREKQNQDQSRGPWSPQHAIFIVGKDLRPQMAKRKIIDDTLRPVHHLLVGGDIHPLQRCHHDGASSDYICIESPLYVFAFPTFDWGDVRFWALHGLMYNVLKQGITVKQFGKKYENLYLIESVMPAYLEGGVAQRVFETLYSHKTGIVGIRVRHGPSGGYLTDTYWLEGDIGIGAYDGPVGPEP